MFLGSAALKMGCTGDECPMLCVMQAQADSDEVHRFRRGAQEFVLTPSQHWAKFIGFMWVLHAAQGGIQQRVLPVLLKCSAVGVLLHQCSSSQGKLVKW